MAERPDLEYALPLLAEELRGARVARVEVDRPVVVRVATARPDDRFEPPQIGATFGAISRRAHFARLELDAADARGARPLEIVVAPMLAGRFRIDPEGAKRPRDAAVTWTLEDGRSLVYRDDVQMGKVYLVERGDEARVPNLAQVGLDALDPAVFTRDAFRALALARRDQAKVFLLDKSAIDALGNAYADEVLFEARIHPKAWVRRLSPDRVDALHAAIVSVLERARATIRARRPAIDEKLRDFLAVRGRAGEPCVRCGTKLRRAGVHGHDAVFCPSCQPDDRGAGLVDWRKLGVGPAVRDLPPPSEASGVGRAAAPPQDTPGGATPARAARRASARRTRR